MPPLQVDDIQGIVAYGYGRLQSACFLLLGIADPARARAWLKTLDVRSATTKPDRTDRCANIAFTRAGLETLGAGADLIAGFAGEFQQGMAATDHRRRILGDTGDSHPDRWDWGGPRTREPHVLLMLYAADATALSAFEDEQRAAFSSGGLDLVTRLGAGWLPGAKEHFGFRDGVSRTGIDGLDTGLSAQNMVAAGEFVLGYPNAYGQYTDRPLVGPERDPAGLLPPAPDDPGRRDLGMNGSYLVFRQLSQDVSGFWRSIDGKTRAPDGSADPAARVRLASKMVGRWPGGAPLVTSPDRDDPARSEDNAFLFHGSDDARGFKCPIGSHVRRANPRDALEPEPGSERSIDVGKRHRILRRGRVYGDPVADSMEIDAIVAAGDAPGERGLHFICFNTHIGRQFEFIQHTWINNPKFDGLYEDDDPVTGARTGPAGTFTIQSEPICTRVTGLPRFVHVRGGGYFFMPGIRALKFLASLP
jgi:Dyp-type peroxidase family